MESKYNLHTIKEKLNIYNKMLISLGVRVGLRVSFTYSSVSGDSMMPSQQLSNSHTMLPRQSAGSIYLHFRFSLCSDLHGSSFELMEILRHNVCTSLAIHDSFSIRLFLKKNLQRSFYAEGHA